MKTYSSKSATTQAMGSDTPRKEGQSRCAFTLLGHGKHLARLISLRKALRMEVMGQRTPQSFFPMVRRMFNMPADSTNTEVLMRIQREIEDFQK